MRKMSCRWYCDFFMHFLLNYRTKRFCCISLRLTRGDLTDCCDCRMVYTSEGGRIDDAINSRLLLHVIHTLTRLVDVLKTAVSVFTRHQDVVIHPLRAIGVWNVHCCVENGIFLTYYHIVVGFCDAMVPCLAAACTEPASRYIPAVGTTTRLGSRYRAGECSGLDASLVVRGIKFTVVDLFLFCLLSWPDRLIASRRSLVSG